MTSQRTANHANEWNASCKEAEHSPALPNVDAVHQDEDEWIEPWKRGADISHRGLKMGPTSRDRPVVSKYIG
jgi:hypothetical protein